jgi:5-methylthioadenosine/S-adenosylhomocysteine deaminase
MRACSLLQRVRLLDGTALAAQTAFDLGTRSAGALLRLEAGTIAAGQLGDLVAIDLGHLSLQPRNDLLKSVVYAMSPEAVTDVWVHGRRVVEARRLATLSEADLVARVAALTKGWTI